MNVAVIGSGTAALAVVQALVDRGLRPTVLDVGETLDPERAEIVRRLSAMSVQDWPVEDARRIRDNATVRIGKHLPKKLHFGSSYIYAADRAFAPIDAARAGRVPFPTFARGGFSNIWGGAVLPVAAEDMADWPIARSALDPYFRKLARLVPLCAGEGTLGRTFPTYGGEPGNIDAGPQGRALLRDLAGAGQRLAERGMLYGKARLAIHTRDDGDALACTGCGECFTGCVRGSIFASRPAMDRLVTTGQVGYRPQTYVERLTEVGDDVCLDLIDLTGPTRRTERFDAVFVAAGPINTARLMLRSRGLYDQPILLKESQKFVVPLLRAQAAPTAAEQPSVTLAAAFLEWQHRALSDHWIHVQVIPMHQMIVEGSGLPGATHPRLGRVWAPLLRRLMMAWVGLHSDHSSAVRLTLRQGGSEPDRLDLDFNVSERARAEARQVAGALVRHGLSFHSLFLPPLLRFSNPGSGTHCGAAFPMRATPRAPLDSDALGRPFGWRRTFLADSSVLPSIPGTTLAYTVMANAWRIATEAPLVPKSPR